MFADGYLLCAVIVFDMVNKYLTRPGEELKVPIPASSIAGALAGFSSTLCTYPLELLKTRFTVQVNSIIYSLKGGTGFIH